MTISHLLPLFKQSHEGSSSRRQASTSSETAQRLDAEIIAEDKHRADPMQSIQVDLPRFLSHISVPSWQSRISAREEKASTDTYLHHISSPHSMLPDPSPLPHPTLSDNIWSRQARRLDTPPWQNSRQQVAVKAEEEEESVDAEVDGGALDGFSSDEFVYSCQSSLDWSNASPRRWQHTLPAATRHGPLMSMTGEGDTVEATATCPCSSKR